VTDKEPTDLAEVWGETVSLRNLALSLAISVPTTVIVYYIGHAVLIRTVSDPDRADTFSLLCGLACVVVCAVLCARMFVPQRVLVDDPVADSSSVEDALRELSEDEGGLGSVADLPPAVVREMKDLDLYDAFVRAEEKYGRTGA
jgi:hypothetical protein